MTTQEIISYALNLINNRIAKYTSITTSDGSLSEILIDHLDINFIAGEWHVQIQGKDKDGETYLIEGAEVVSIS